MSRLRERSVAFGGLSYDVLFFGITKGVVLRGRGYYLYGILGLLFCQCS